MNINYPASAAGSERLFAEAIDAVPGGRNSCRRESEPPMFGRGEGAHLYDLAGRRYTDYVAARGAIVLGHSYPSVVEAVQDAIRDTVLVGLGITPAEVALGRKIVEHVPSVEQVLLCNSGSEATFHAIRLARAVTGRQLIVKYEGCYHGFHDYVLRNVGSPANLVGKRDPGSAGMLDPAVDATLVCRFNDLDNLRDTFEAHPDRIAGVIIEPILHNSASIMPEDGFLEGVQRLCAEYGALFILDEVITGFRHSLGGYQALAGLDPDITTMGKALGNGFPVAAIGGKRRLMERFNTTDDGDVFFGGTFSGNTVGAVAGLATIEALERDGAFETLFRRGVQMRSGLEWTAAELGIPAVVAGYGSIYALLFMEGEVSSYGDFLRNDREMELQFRAALTARRILWRGRNHVSLSHTADDVDDTLVLVREALIEAADATMTR